MVGPEFGLLSCQCGYLNPVKVLHKTGRGVLNPVFPKALLWTLHSACKCLRGTGKGFLSRAPKPMLYTVVGVSVYSVNICSVIEITKTLLSL